MGVVGVRKMIILLILLVVGLLLVNSVSAQLKSPETITESNNETKTVTEKGVNYCKEDICYTELFATYWNGSEYKQINTSIVVKNEEGYEYQIKQGKYHVFFQDKPIQGPVFGRGTPVTPEPAVKLVKKDYEDSGNLSKVERKTSEITFQPEGIYYRTITDYEQRISMPRSVNGIPEENSFAYNDIYRAGFDLIYYYDYVDLRQVLKLSNKSIFPPPEKFISNSLLPSFDMDFVITTDDKIIINNKEWNKNNEKGTSDEVYITDSNNNIIYYFSKPIAYDSNFSYINISYEFKKKDTSLYVIVSTPAWWLNSTERVYPVYIDPSFNLPTELPSLNTTPVYLQEDELNTYTQDSDTIQFSNTMAKTRLYSTVRNVKDEVGWMRVEDAGSLKDKQHLFHSIEMDENYPMRMIDYNATNYVGCFKKKNPGKENIPLNIYDKFGNTIFNITRRLNKEEELCYILPFGIDKNIEWGLNTTKVTIITNSTHKAFHADRCTGTGGSCPAINGWTSSQTEFSSYADIDTDDGHHYNTTSCSNRGARADHFFYYNLTKTSVVEDGLQNISYYWGGYRRQVGSGYMGGCKDYVGYYDDTQANDINDYGNMPTSDGTRKAHVTSGFSDKIAADKTVRMIAGWGYRSNGNAQVQILSDYAYVELTYVNIVFNITDPLTPNPRSVNDNENISIFFLFQDDGVNITSGVTVNSVTIGGTAATILDTGACSGTPTDCGDYGTQSPCEVAGCTWNAEGCTGGGCVCSGVAQANCECISGCSWSGSSCPIIAAWDGTAWIYEHEAYPFAVFKAIEDTTYDSAPHAKCIDGEAKIMIEESLDEINYLYDFKTYATKNNENGFIKPDVNGNVRLIQKKIDPDRCSSALYYTEEECLARIKENDDWFFEPEFDENVYFREMALEFDEITADEVKLYVVARKIKPVDNYWNYLVNSLGTQKIELFDWLSGGAMKNIIRNTFEWARPAVEVWDGEDWVKTDSFAAGHHMPGEGQDDFLFILPNLDKSDSTLKVRLYWFDGLMSFDQVYLDDSSDPVLETREIKPKEILFNNKTIPDFNVSMVNGDIIIATYDCKEDETIWFGISGRYNAKSIDDKASRPFLSAMYDWGGWFLGGAKFSSHRMAELGMQENACDVSEEYLEKRNETPFPIKVIYFSLTATAILGVAMLFGFDKKIGLILIGVIWILTVIPFVGGFGSCSGSCTCSNAGTSGCCTAHSCSWSAASCSGEPQGCANHPNSTDCTNSGCNWANNSYWSDGLGWIVNVTVPADKNGLQDLFIEVDYLGGSYNDTETESISYPDTTAPTVYQIAPPNGTSNTTREFTLSCNATDGVDIDNVTLWHDLSGSYVSNVTLDLSSQVNVSVFFENNFVDITPGLYHWNCRACDNSSNCGTASNNWTLDVANHTQLLIEWFNPTTHRNHSQASLDLYQVNISCITNTAPGTCAFNYSIDPAILLNDTTRNIADIRAEDQASGHPSNDEQVQMRWNISSIGDYLGSATLCLWVTTTLGMDNDLTFWRVDNQTWQEQISATDYNLLSTTNHYNTTMNSTADDAWTCINVTGLVGEDWAVNSYTSFRFHDADIPWNETAKATYDTSYIRTFCDDCTGDPQMIWETRELQVGQGNAPYLYIEYTSEPPKVLIPACWDEPFCTDDTNPGEKTLNNGESVIVNWTVNATGTIGWTYIFFANTTLLSDSSVTNGTLTLNVTIDVAAVSTSVSFSLTLPSGGGDYWNSTDTPPGTATTGLDFNSSSFNQNFVHACVRDTSCQTNATAVFQFRNTGNVNISFDLNLNASMPDGIYLHSDTASDYPSYLNISTSNTTIVSNLGINNTTDVFLWASFVNKYGGGNHNRDIQSISREVS